MTLTKEQILSAPDMQLEEVEVPEWGGSIFVRPMSGIDRDAMEAFVIERNESLGPKAAVEQIRAWSIARTTCTEDGTLLFSKEDIPELNKKNSAALDRIFKVIRRLSGLTEDAKKNPLASGQND